ncbi:hypothetical protein F5H01DRAFT_144256 [Linnemannia elongata]|nr:hypothetical protein F5H01DRAFT_144256 [Linnemannia elongata]
MKGTVHFFLFFICSSPLLMAACGMMITCSFSCSLFLFESPPSTSFLSSLDPFLFLFSVVFTSSSTTSSLSYLLPPYPFILRFPLPLPSLPFPSSHPFTHFPFTLLPATFFTYSTRLLSIPIPISLSHFRHTLSLDPLPQVFNSSHSLSARLSSL